MPEEEVHNTWYVAQDKSNAKNAFTQVANLAAKDLMGAPIIAPGHLIRYQKVLVKKVKAVLKERQAQAWDEGFHAGIRAANSLESPDNPYKEVRNELDVVVDSG